MQAFRHHLSRYWMLCLTLCLAAVVNLSVITVDAQVQNTVHMASGDILLPDGGWATACGGEGAGCHDHAPLVKHHSDNTGVEHHHHFSETVSAPLPLMAQASSSGYVRNLTLRPGEAVSLTGLLPSSLDQPPRG